MTKIKKILGADDHGDYAIVHVLLDNGEEAEVWVGGFVECWFDPAYNKFKAFVKKS